MLIGVRGMWLRRFPPKQKLLTNEEYYEQTVRETTKALENLKNFCNSPEAKPWRVMMKLKDPQRYGYALSTVYTHYQVCLLEFLSVDRFASFIEGSPHLLDSEILEYETSAVNNSDISDDSDDELQPDPASRVIVSASANGQTRYRNISKSMQTSTPIENGRARTGNGSSRLYESQMELSEDDE